LSDKISISLAFSAAILLLLAATSPLPLSNPLLQPAQASTSITGARTQAPVNGTLSCGGGGGGANPIDAKLTFTVQGTSIDNEWYTIHNGTFQLTNSSNGQILYSHNGGYSVGGSIDVGNKDNWTIAAEYGIDGGKFLCGANSISMYITTTCNGEFETISIYRGTGGSIGTLPNGVIQCGDFGDGDTTAQQPSSSMTGTAQDSDGDGIPDSSDNCTHNSNPRCFKEDTTTQQQPSSTSMARNQTR